MQIHHTFIMTQTVIDLYQSQWHSQKCELGVVLYALLFLPLPSIHPLTSPFYPCFLPLEVAPLLFQLKVWGSAVCSPTEVWDTAPAEIKPYAIIVLIYKTW